MINIFWANPTTLPLCLYSPQLLAVTCTGINFPIFFFFPLFCGLFIFFPMLKRDFAKDELFCFDHFSSFLSKIFHSFLQFTFKYVFSIFSFKPSIAIEFFFKMVAFSSSSSSAAGLDYYHPLYCHYYQVIYLYHLIH